DGEVLVASNRGVHRWLPVRRAWELLQTNAVLRNPSLAALTPIGNELWVGYTNQSFGVTGQQGISRFNERSGRWSYISPEQIGTRCPVRQIVSLSANDVWVLFHPRPWLGSAIEFHFYPREAPERKKPPFAPGLGHYSAGKW